MALKRTYEAESNFSELSIIKNVCGLCFIEMILV